MRFLGLWRIFVFMQRLFWKYYGATWSVVCVDQIFKLWVHYHMIMGYAGTIPLMGSWLKLCYVLNPGMAFGIQFAPPYGKLLLTLGRILITYAIVRHIEKLRRERPLSTWSARGWTWILGGAIGNSIDSIFYGMLLGNAPHDAPTAWGHGQVIDMIHLDLWRAQLPAWLPFLKGHHVHLFPIFNIADVAILVGIFMILCVPRRLPDL